MSFTIGKFLRRFFIGGLLVIGCGFGWFMSTGVTVYAAAFVTVPRIATNSSYSSISTVAYLKSDGTVWFGGNNEWGQYGNNTETQPGDPNGLAESSITGVSSVAVGNGYSLFLKPDGTVWYAGNGYMNSTINSGSTPTSPYKWTPTQISGLSNVTAIAASGSNHSLFLLSNGTVFASGNDTYGQMGNGTTSYASLGLTQVSGLTNVTAIAAGDATSYFLKSDGTVWAVGYNNHGQLGIGSKTTQTTPVQVSGLTGITAIAAGDSHAIFLKNDGTVYGTGIYSALGFYKSQGDQLVPVKLSGLSNIVSISAGEFTNLFLKNDGTVWGLGQSENGQIGYGSTAITQTPVQVSNVSNVVTMAAAQYNSSFLENDGSAWITGKNSETISTYNTTVPVTLGLSLGAVSLSEELSGTMDSSAPAGSPTASQTASVSVTAGNFGVTPLSSIINLGSIAPSSTALAAGSDIRVDDERGTGAGWHLMVSAPQLQNAAGQKLPSGSLMLQDPLIAVVGDSASTYPLLQVNQFLVDTGSSTEVASAAVGTGMGSYKIGFDHADSARLTVPASTYAGTYSTALTWQLVSGP